MKKHAFVLIVWTVILGATAARCEHIRHTWHFSRPLIDQTRADSCGVVKVVEAPDTLMMHDWPVLPRAVIQFTFPFKTGIENIRITTGTSHSEDLDGPLPFNSSLHFLSDPTSSPRYPELSAGDSFPDSPVKITRHGGIDPGTFQPVSSMVIELFPCRYLHPDRLIWTDRIEISFDTIEPAGDIRYRMHRDPVPLLVITSSALAPSTTDYLAFRAAYGPPASLLTTEEIMESYAGVDDAQKMRNAILDYALNNGTIYVLLAGDSDQVPVRRTVQMNDSTMNVPMEAYFSDLFDSLGNPIDWDAGGDSVFGQYPADMPEMDMMPDILLGRIPASTPDELQLALDRVVSYEQTASSSDEWFNRVVFTAVDIFTFRDHGDTSGIPEGERFAEMLRIDPFESMETIRLYETDQYAHEGRATSAEVHSALHDGAGFLAFHCHGAPDCFWLIDECFTGSQAGNLDNGIRSPVTFGFACSTAAFDNELPDWPYGSVTESMPERFLLNESGGAISYVGSTRVAVASSFGHAQQRKGTGALEYPYFQGYFASMQTPGQLIANAQCEYLRRTGISDDWDFTTLAEYAQFGDPATAIGGIRQPGSISILDTGVSVNGNPHACAAPGDTIEILPQLLNSGSPRHQITITSSSSDPRIQWTVTQASVGTLLRGYPVAPSAPLAFQILPGTDDEEPIHIEVSIRAAGDEIQRSQITIPLGAAPHIVFHDHEIYYDESGNVNIDPGDQIYLAMLLENDGCNSLEGAVIRMTSSSAYLEYCYSEPTSLPTLPAGWGMVSPWGALRFVVRETTPDQTIIPITVTVTDGQAEFTKFCDLVVRDRIGPSVVSPYIDVRSAIPGTANRMECAVFDVSGVQSVSATVHQVSAGSDQTVVFNDTGADGDRIAGDGIYSASCSIPPEPDNFMIDIITVDGLGNTAVFSSILRFSSIPLLPAPVILINEIGKTIEQSTVREALERLGMTPAIWDVEFRGRPSPRDLKRYTGNTVIYMCHSTPPTDMLETLTAFCQMGGAVVLNGWDAARQINRLSGGTEWLETQFGVRFISKNADDYMLAGESSDPFGDGLEYRLKKKVDNVIMEPDVIEGINGGIVAVHFTSNQAAAGAIRFDSGLSRTLFFPYSLDDIKDLPDLDVILDKAIDWTSDRTVPAHLDLEVNQTCYASGDAFTMIFDVVNPTPTSLSGRLFLVLNLADDYWFWPSFVHHSEGYDFQSLSVSAFDTAAHDMAFTWPESPVSIPQITFLAALLDEGMTHVILGMETVQFGFEPDCPE